MKRGGPKLEVVVWYSVGSPCFSSVERDELPPASKRLMVLRSLDNGTRPTVRNSHVRPWLRVMVQDVNGKSKIISKVLGHTKYSTGHVGVVVLISGVGVEEDVDEEGIYAPVTDEVGDEGHVGSVLEEKAHWHDEGVWLGGELWRAAGQDEGRELLPDVPFRGVRREIE